MEITQWAQIPFHKSLSVNTVCRAIQLNAQSCKEEAICEPLCASALLKQTETKWKSVLWLDESKFEILFKE